MKGFIRIDGTKCLNSRLVYRNRLNFKDLPYFKDMQIPNVPEQSDSLSRAAGSGTEARTTRRGVSLKEPVLIALETLRTHKLRSFLTLLGIILSVSTLIVVVSMVEGTNKYVADKVANFGSNVFLIMRFPITTSRDQFVKLQRTNKTVTWEDYEFLRDNMSLDKEVGAEARTNGKVKYK